MAELLNYPENFKTDGISYLPGLLKKEGQKQHPYLYWEFHEQGGKQAVRMGKWKAVRLNVHKNPDAPLELYNLEEDPAETKNIADQYPEIIESCLRAMEKEHVTSNDFPFEFELNLQ
jgi:arylsulfatase A-like enzyme